MTYAIELNKMNDEYIVMLDSMNSYADELVLENKVLEDASQLVKELRLIK